MKRAPTPGNSRSAHDPQTSSKKCAHRLSRPAALALLALAAGCTAVARYPNETAPSAPVPGAKFAGAEWLKDEDFRRRGTHGRALGFDELVVMARAPAAAGSAGHTKDLAGPAGLCAFTPAGPAWLVPEHTAITGKVSGALATVTVAQRFLSPSEHVAELGYRLPLPAGAAVTDFVLAVGERRIRGIVRERGEAERIFEEARRQGHLVSLVGAERAWFAVRLANLAAGTPVDARATWFCQVPCRDGLHELAIPALGPAEAANPDSGRPGAPPPAVRTGLKLDLDGGLPIESLETPGHDPTVERPRPGSASINLGLPGPLDRDFLLRYRLTGAQTRSAVLVHAGPTLKTFALTIHPPAAVKPAGPREVIFLLGAAIPPAGPEREALQRCLGGLRPTDSFLLADAPGRGVPVPATAEDFAAARERLARLRPAGGRLADRLARLLALPADAGRARRVVLVTDGRAADALLPVLRERLGQGRLVVLAAGDVVDRRGIGMLAEAGRGAAVGAGDAGALARALEGPAVNDLRVDWGDLAVREVCPARLGELFPGRPLTIVGRADGAGRHRVVVTGRTGGREFRQELTVDLDAATADHPGVEKLWQLRRLAELEDAELAAPGPEARRKVIEASLGSGLVSRYTEILTVDTAETGGR